MDGDFNPIYVSSLPVTGRDGYGDKTPTVTNDPVTVDRLRAAVEAHESDGYRSWYVDEFVIDVDAVEFWAVIAKALEKLQGGAGATANAEPDIIERWLGRG